MKNFTRIVPSATRVRLEVDDLVVRPPPLLLGREALDPFDQHPAVPGPVQHRHATPARQDRPEPPQEVVPLLVMGRSGELRDPHVPRVQLGHQPLDGTTLAGGVPALEDHAQRRVRCPGCRRHPRPDHPGRAAAATAGAAARRAGPSPASWSAGNQGPRRRVGPRAQPTSSRGSVPVSRSWARAPSRSGCRSQYSPSWWRCRWCGAGCCGCRVAGRRPAAWAGCVAGSVPASRVRSVISVMSVSFGVTVARRRARGERFGPARYRMRTGLSPAPPP